MEKARAHARALRDLKELRAHPLEGIAAEPLEDDALCWHANLGLGGVHMHFEIHLPQNYPKCPPAIFFPTGLPHPNCFSARAPDGRPSHRICLDMLEEGAEVGSGWSSAYGMHGLLLQLQSFILDHRAQYKRTGSLEKTEAVQRAKKYSCPLCSHSPGHAFPVHGSSRQPMQLTLIRALAPQALVPSQTRSASLHISHIAKRVAAVEPKLWRDVQRVALHASLQSTEITRCQAAVCLDSGAGFQVVKRKGGKIATAQPLLDQQILLNKQMGVETRRFAAAIRIQKAARMLRARRLLDCRRRLQLMGHMTSALRSAYEESQRLRGVCDVHAGQLREAKQVQSQAQQVMSIPLEDRALRTALVTVQHRRRNLQKKLLQIKQLTLKCDLTFEEQQKAGRLREIEEELRLMGSKATLHSSLVGKNLEGCEGIETLAFYNAFEQALTSEKDAAARLRVKARKKLRFAQLKAKPSMSKSEIMGRHIAVARRVFFDMMVDRQVAKFRASLPDFLRGWRKAVVTARKPHRLVQASPAGCLIIKVPYSVQVGTLLPFLDYQSLLPLTCANRKLRSLAEDGCLWSVHMSRHHPLSSLTPASMKDWKYAFICEVNQAVSELRCFHTKSGIFDAGVVLGIPIEFTVNPRTNLTDYIYSSMDFLSKDAFLVDGVRKNVLKEDFTQWLPMYINEDHWQRGLPAIKSALPNILGGAFRPEMTVELFTKMINTLTVLVCDKGITFSDRAVRTVCFLQRWILRCVEQWPGLQKFIDDRVDAFCKDEKKRSKEYEPNLGEFMSLLLASKRSWTKVAPHVLTEWLSRQVLWVCQEYPCLANLGERGAPTDDERLQKTWAANQVSKRLFAFHGMCFNLFKQKSPRDLAHEHDALYGQPSNQVVRSFHDGVKAVLGMQSWSDFFQFVGFAPGSRAKFVEMLRDGVRNSRKRGYHKDGMDFNRVHASGTSKILRKGESFLAAATLNEVDLEEHWSWADGETKFLDATCVLYDVKHQKLGHLDYSQTSFVRANGKAVPRTVLCHSGDQIDNEKQSGFHQIGLGLNSLPAEVHYLYITVSSWMGARLKDIKQPSVRLSERGGAELCRYNVDSASGEKTSILMCVLHRRVERSTESVSRWSLEAIGEVGDGSASNYGPLFAMIDKFRKAKGW